MIVSRSHKLALQPTPGQEQALRRAAGVARFTWNWALAEWKAWHKAGKKPTAMKLKKHFNAVKRERFPWLYDSPRDANAQPVANLGQAFRNFFDGQAKYPKLKKKGRCRDAFYVANDKFGVDGKAITLPRIGKVKMREALRFAGKVTGATVSRTPHRWFVAISVEVDLPVVRCENQARTVGVDLGVKRLATLSDGTFVDGPKPLRRTLTRVRRLCRALSRKVKGSRNREKARHRLARAILDMGFGEFRRQLDYKQELAAAEVVVADRWFPSSRTCSACGERNERLTLKDRIFHCRGCGLAQDRDLNAARNLERYPGLRGNPYAS